MTTLKHFKRDLKGTAVKQKNRRHGVCSSKLGRVIWVSGEANALQSFYI